MQLNDYSNTTFTGISKEELERQAKALDGIYSALVTWKFPTVTEEKHEEIVKGFKKYLAEKFRPLLMGGSLVIEGYSADEKGQMNFTIDTFYKYVDIVEEEMDQTANSSNTELTAEDVLKALGM